MINNNYKDKFIDINKEKKEKDPINIFYMIKKIYPMCFKSNPLYYIFNQTIGIFHGILQGLNVMFAQVFFDAVYTASVEKSTIGKVMLALVIFITIKILCDILNAVHNFSHNVQRTRIMGFMCREICKKSALIDPIEYENPERLDDVNKAANGAGSAIHFHIATSTIVTFYFPYFIFIGFYLYNLKPVLIITLLFIFIPVIISQILRSSIFSKLEDKVTPIRRELDAYNDAASGKWFFKETRILGSFEYFKNLLINTIDSLNLAVWRTSKRGALINFGFNTLSLLGYGGVLFLLVKYLLAGEISVGAFAAVYYSIGMLFGIMNEIISNHLGTLANNFGLIRNFLRFLEIPIDNRLDIDINKKESIMIENVSFKYPNSEKECLKNINLTVEPGEIIAIVGENGSGKTTLVKLLTGLYKPTEGSVKIGKTNVNNISYKLLFKNMSGIFQKYQRYALTLKENIQISDFHSQNSVEKILEKNSIYKDDKDIFPNELDTILSREFDGVDLSGGQWQRIAIARGFYRNSDIIILDEPTASIDPFEESAIYKKFIEIAKGKTAIIVTHRLGSAKIADRIVVMKDGEIIEIGSHNKLIHENSFYANMYSAQAIWYS